jgi:hypothetical protein
LAELEIETIQKQEGKCVLTDLDSKGWRICDNSTRILTGGVSDPDQDDDGSGRLATRLLEAAHLLPDISCAGSRNRL